MTGSVGGYRTLAPPGAHHAAPPAGASAPPSEDRQLPWHEPIAPSSPVQSGSPLDQRWRVPVVHVDLPTPARAVHDGAELLRRWHPRDPDLRVHGTFEPRPTTADTPQADTRATRAVDGEGTAKADERSPAARIAMLVGLGGGLMVNALDAVRLVKKYPEAVRARQFDPTLGRLGRLPTAVGLTLIRPDNRIIDPVAPRAASMASAGRSFTHFDELTMKASVLMGTSLAALQIGASIPNLMDALDNEGPWYENLAMSTSGRAGVLQLTGGTIGAAVFATALRQTLGEGGGTLVGRVIAAGKAPIMARPVWGRIGLATGAIVAANELGFFDRLNRGESRSLGQTLSEATHRTPVLNDASTRTTAFLAAGGIVGFKAHRAVSAAGGMAGLGRGHVIGGAVVAGLLGAQLLGGLRGMDKPAEG